MRGKKAKALRRAELPADLKAELEQRITTIALARTAALHDARRQRDELVRKAEAEYKRSRDQAWKTSLTARANVEAEFARRAEARKAGAEAGETANAEAA